MWSLPVAAVMIQWLQTSQLFYLQFQRLDAQSQTEQADDVKGQAKLAASAGPCEQSLFLFPALGCLWRSLGHVVLSLSSNGPFLISDSLSLPSG